MSPTEAKQSLLSQCQELQRLFAGHSVPTRRLLLSLREQLAPLVELGLHRTDIYDTIRSSGLQVSSALVFEVLRTLFGPSRSTHKAPLPGSFPAEQQADADEPLSMASPTPLDRSGRPFHMVFGDHEEAEEQQERLARARAKIEAERERKRLPAVPRQSE